MLNIFLKRFISNWIRKHALINNYALGTVFSAVDTKVVIVQALNFRAYSEVGDTEV